MVDLRQMRYFVTLAETMHFGRAAERLHMTQPPLSRQIAALEQSLGVRLLERSTRHVELTHAGQRFLEDARSTLMMADQACDNARLAERGELGELKVGFMMHAAFTILPKLTKRFLAAHPQVKLHLREMIPSALTDEILTGQCDAGVLFPPKRIKGLEFRVVHAERLCLAIPRGHSLTDAARITPRVLKGEHLIAASEDVSPVLRGAITGWFRTAGIVPAIRLETQLQQTIVSFVAEGLGVALVPESMAKLGVAGVDFRPLERAPKIEHGIAWRPENLNPSLPLFLKASGAA
ncbi:LysR substrate-binding domain-containing protein [Luteolibacter flavescens]|uniref:LysR substrate-binding domain-containing protein n=1 Tax=Luteolibacter flavescens TaxID=1859460 RepID=A0ABT3FLJ0_9BACT|nr:LysR substrate-binding domain-containing protein [Luteolibacter flavescens]MCW1884219.1 LysR substrate-binding domain-containing protein [Luteolibacter flavescens]